MLVIDPQSRFFAEQNIEVTDLIIFHVGYMYRHAWLAKQTSGYP